MTTTGRLQNWCFDVHHLLLLVLHQQRVGLGSKHHYFLLLVIWLQSTHLISNVSVSLLHPWSESVFQCFSYSKTVSSIRTMFWCLGGVSTGLTSFTFCTRSTALKGKEPRYTWHWRLGDISTTVSSRTRYTSWNLQEHKKKISFSGK